MATAVALERFVNGYIARRISRRSLPRRPKWPSRRRRLQGPRHVLGRAGPCPRPSGPRGEWAWSPCEGSWAFFYHMWTEVYVDGRWVPIDGTLGKGGIGAAHCKLGQGCLDGVAAYSSFLTLGQITGRLKVEVIDAE